MNSSVVCVKMCCTSAVYSAEDRTSFCSLSAEILGAMM